MLTLQSIITLTSDFETEGLPTTESEVIAIHPPPLYSIPYYTYFDLVDAKGFS